MPGWRHALADLTGTWEKKPSVPTLIADRMARIFLLGCLLLSITTALADDVVVGTGSNFDKIIGKNSFVVAEFYAPWCGHCKHLEPEYAKAATQLKEEKAGITLVKVGLSSHESRGSILINI